MEGKGAETVETVVGCIDHQPMHQFIISHSLHRQHQRNNLGELQTPELPEQTAGPDTSTPRQTARFAQTVYHAKQKSDHRGARDSPLACGKDGESVKVAGRACSGLHTYFDRLVQVLQSWKQLTQLCVGKYQVRWRGQRNNSKGW